MSDREETLADEYARREDVCGVFCDAKPTVSFIDEWGVEVHWCRDCYEKPCSHCGGWIEDENKRKGMCQDRRDEIRMWGGDEERGIEKEPDSEQTTLLTDGGTDSFEREHEYHEEGFIGEVRKETDYYLYKKHETSTASYGTVSDRDCPDCGSLMLFFPHLGDDICPECGCWLTTGIPEFVEQAAEAMGEDPEKYVEEVNTK